MRLNWGKTFVLGFGFLAISAVWPLYDSYMPNFLSKFIGSSAVIAGIMALDNVLGFTLQPWFGSLSDRTESRWGRRRPFLLIGMPIAAAALLTLPFTHAAGLLPLLLTTGTLNLSMAVFRAPTVALMPDLTPAALRSKANGVINFMGGIGSAIVLQAGKMLYPLNPGYPFVAAAGIMIVVFFLFLFIIREPEVAQEAATSEEEKPRSLLRAAQELVRSRDHNALFLFFAIFSWFAAYISVSTWFTMYANEQFGVPINVASGSLLYYTVAFILGALPAGFIGNAFGRRRTITIGIAGLGLAFAVMHFMPSLGIMTPLLVVGGFSWALININSYPMVAELCDPSQTGTYTGLYYIFSGIGGASGPFLVGIVFDLIGSKRPMFLTSVVFMALAFIFISLVRKGEPQTVKKAG